MNPETNNGNKKIIKVLAPAICVLVAALLIQFTTGFHNPLGLFLCPLGLLFTYIAVAISISQETKIAKYTGMCQGKVINYVHRSTGSRNTMRNTYSPVVSFYAYGQEFISSSNISNSKDLLPKLGESVTVYYDPSDPNKMQLEKDFGNARILVTVFLIVGIIITATGLGLSVLFI